MLRISGLHNNDDSSPPELNNVEKLLVVGGTQCACCVGRFEFERGLDALLRTHPAETFVDMLSVNPLFIRQLPSFTHQMVLAQNIMDRMQDDLPALVAAWCQHELEYPDISYVIHSVLAERQIRVLHGNSRTLVECLESTLFTTERNDISRPTTFELKKRALNPVYLSQCLQHFVSVARKPFDIDPQHLAYLPQIEAMLESLIGVTEEFANDRSDRLRPQPSETDDQARVRKLQIKSEKVAIELVVSEIAENLIPVILSAHAVTSRRNLERSFNTLMRRLFAAGGDYRKSDFNIAAFALELGVSRVLLSLDEQRHRLNDASIRTIDTNIERIRVEDEKRRAIEAERREQARQERLIKAERKRILAEEQAQIEAARQERRTEKHAARNESFPEIRKRLAKLDPVARMTELASHKGYAPSIFPKTWASRFTGVQIEKLDDEALAKLVERTKGVQRGEWRKLHNKLVSAAESRSKDGRKGS